MNYNRLQYRLPYGDGDLDDSFLPENFNSDFEEAEDEEKEESGVELRKLN